MWTEQVGGSSWALPSHCADNTTCENHMEESAVKLSHLTKTSPRFISSLADAVPDTALALSAHSYAVYTCFSLFLHTSSGSRFLSTLPAQLLMTEWGMLLVLYRPLKITHPSLPSEAGLTAPSGQSRLRIPASSTHSLSLSASLIGRQWHHQPYLPY